MFVWHGPLLHPAIVPAGGLTLILGWISLGGHAAFCWDCNPMIRGG